MEFHIEHFNSLPSTNAYLKELAERGEARNGEVVVADFQTSGRGRIGRQWLAPPGKGLLYSVLIFPDLEAECLGIIGLLVGLASLEGIKRYLCSKKIVLKTNFNQINYSKESSLDDIFTLKWPNDIIANEEKLGGVLCEAGFDSQGRQFVVAGVGINVQQNYSDLPNYYRTPPTSLFILTGMVLQPKDLLSYQLSSLEEHLSRLSLEGIDWVSVEFARRTKKLGKEVILYKDNEKIIGRFISIDRDGALCLMLPNGTLQRYYNGDIHCQEEHPHRKVIYY